MKNAFHLAIAVSDLEKAKAFYRDLLGAEEGRTDNCSWVDFNFFGHQLSCHLIKELTTAVDYNKVEALSVPIPHFGLIVESGQFEEFKQILEQAQISFILKPQVRFENREEEHQTMFFKDPFGNCLEIKSFTKAKGF